MANYTNIEGILCVAFWNILCTQNMPVMGLSSLNRHTSISLRIGRPRPRYVEYERYLRYDHIFKRRLKTRL